MRCKICPLPTPLKVFNSFPTNHNKKLHNIPDLHTSAVDHSDKPCLCNHVWDMNTGTTPKKPPKSWDNFAVPVRQSGVVTWHIQDSCDKNLADRRATLSLRTMKLIMSERKPQLQLTARHVCTSFLTSAGIRRHLSFRPTCHHKRHFAAPICRRFFETLRRPVHTYEWV